MQQLRRPYRINTPLLSANAVIMWCMECIRISNCMRLLDRAPVCMGGEIFFAYRDFGSCFSLETSGWLCSCLAGSRLGRPCIHASIAVPRSDAWSASLPWSFVFPYTIAAALTGPIVPGPCLPAPALAHPLLCVPDLTYFSLSLSFCYCRVTILHYTVQPVLAIKTPAPCSWRRGLTSKQRPRY